MARTPDDGPEPAVPTYPDVEPEPEPGTDPPEPAVPTYPDVEPAAPPKAPARRGDDA